MNATASRFPQLPVSSRERMLADLEDSLNSRSGTRDVRITFNDAEHGMTLLSGKRSDPGDVVKVADLLRRQGWKVVRASLEEAHLRLV